MHAIVALVVAEAIALFNMYYWVSVPNKAVEANDRIIFTVLGGVALLLSVYKYRMWQKHSPGVNMIINYVIALCLGTQFVLLFKFNLFFVYPNNDMVSSMNPINNFNYYYYSNIFALVVIAGLFCEKICWNCIKMHEFHRSK